jgi:hypothetical protein
VFVHGRPAELAFLERGFGIDRREVMYNDFGNRPGARRWRQGASTRYRPRRHVGTGNDLLRRRMRLLEVIDFAGIAAPRRSGMPVRIEMNQTICVRRGTLA